MRVTKLIREYVEKVVCEKMPNPEKPKNTICEQYEALIERLNYQVREELKEFARQHSGEFSFAFSGYDPSEVEKQISFVDRSCELRHPRLNSLADREYNQACHNMEVKRKEAIENILVTLELGGNKADLDAMLANL